MQEGLVIRMITLVAHNFTELLLFVYYACIVRSKKVADNNANKTLDPTKREFSYCNLKHTNPVVSYSIV